MSVLSETKILANIYTRDLTINPLNIEFIQPSSIDLTLDDNIEIPKPDIRITPPYPNREEIRNSFIKSTLANSFVLRPGQFILGQVRETLELSDKLVGSVQNRNSIIRLGINVGLSTYINPGYKGKLPIAIHNIGNFDVELVAGMRICQLVLHDTSGVIHGYGKREHSKYHDEGEITLSRLSEDSEFKEYMARYNKDNIRHNKHIADFLEARINESAKSFLDKLTPEQKSELGLA